jgi:hypothetical protein
MPYTFGKLLVVERQVLVVRSMTGQVVSQEAQVVDLVPTSLIKFLLLQKVKQLH